MDPSPSRRPGKPRRIPHEPAAGFRRQCRLSLRESTRLSRSERRQIRKLLIRRTLAHRGRVARNLPKNGDPKPCPARCSDNPPRILLQKAAAYGYLCTDLGSEQNRGWGPGKGDKNRWSLVARRRSFSPVLGRGLSCEDQKPKTEPGTFRAKNTRFGNETIGNDRLETCPTAPADGPFRKLHGRTTC